ncbi:MULTISPECIES: hypothetical protein [Halocynthiibacter]|uniref:Uncharacterized protein n=1 Tax=Halocynthiibacter halioticoli TaxID=2986804 RepID=A0AAE3J0N3_9RHOB|nr:MULTISPECIES: hypothetical protein [Halocynthiibacter]MCV6825817.1 hypothetical protein [Halocynthiibacter halioticoli]MCW4058818.1 hypothetical protein [Halocynthiibacter sp. SDUM655004]
MEMIGSYRIRKLDEVVLAALNSAELLERDILKYNEIASRFFGFKVEVGAPAKVLIGGKLNSLINAVAINQNNAFSENFHKQLANTDPPGD